MEEKGVYKNLISLLKGHFTGNKENIGDITDEKLSLLFSVAKKHDILGIVASELIEKGYIDKNTSGYSAFSKALFIDFARYERINYDKEELYAIFSENKIYFIPLKGVVLREYYPVKELRTSADIDILIDKKDVKSALLALKEKGYKVGKLAEHDVSVESPSETGIELHYRLLERDVKTEKLLSDVFITSKKDGYRLTLSDKDFLLFYMAHTVKHFLEGGCGIRSVLDAYVIKNKMGINYEDYRDVLEKAGLYIFTKEFYRLVSVWFNGEKYDDKIEVLEDFIIRGGVYGNTEQRVKIGTANKKSGFKYFLSRVFMPLERMKGTNSYPILNKAPYLYPFCLVHRWFKILFGKGRKKAKRELEITKNLKSEEKEKIQKMLESVGLNKK
ncbi:MAG: nucleotidyltransferase family protein [Clostridia bacterium]|nr:nucleotidyltransferase family protein [Clostridia bacterium]